MAACEANICPGPYACHVTSKSHQIHLSHSWHLTTNPTQVKPKKKKKIPTISLCQSTTLSLSLSFSLHHHLSPPSFLGGDTLIELAQLRKNTPFSLHLVLNLLQKWENKKYSFWLWLTHGLIRKYMWNSWADLAVNIWFGSNFVLRTIKVKRKYLYLRSLAWNGD